MNPQATIIYKAQNPAPERTVGNDVREPIKRELFRAHGYEVKDSLVQTVKRILRGEVSPRRLKAVLAEPWYYEKETSKG